MSEVNAIIEKAVEAKAVRITVAAEPDGKRGRVRVRSVAGGDVRRGRLVVGKLLFEKTAEIGLHPEGLDKLVETQVQKYLALRGAVLLDVPAFASGQRELALYRVGADGKTTVETVKHKEIAMPAKKKSVKKKSPAKKRSVAKKKPVARKKSATKKRSPAKKRSASKSKAKKPAARKKTAAKKKTAKKKPAKKAAKKKTVVSRGKPGAKGGRRPARTKKTRARRALRTYTL